MIGFAIKRNIMIIIIICCILINIIKIIYLIIINKLWIFEIHILIIINIKKWISILKYFNWIIIFIKIIYYIASTIIKYIIIIISLIKIIILIIIIIGIIKGKTIIIIYSLIKWSWYKILLSNKKIKYSIIKF